MADTTKVYLITGFLGSGKTTFLNRVIARFPKDRKLMILMNEFGEIGIDGTLVQTEELEMMEINRGSIFCVCVKSDFIKGLYDAAQKIAPDVMIIESTGVANPSDLKRDLRLPIFKDRYSFMEQFCLIDACNFLDAYGAYASIEKQIASSTLFIINKVDLSDRDAINKIRVIVREFHPDPQFYETTYADFPFESFFFPEGTAAHPPQAGRPEQQALPELSDEQLDRIIGDIFENTQSEMTPPDILMSAAFQWTGSDLDDFRTLTAAMHHDIIRAKGFICNRERVFLFNYTMGDWSIEESLVPSERIRHMNVLVLIGSPAAIDWTRTFLSGSNWIELSTYQPLSAA